MSHTHCISGSGLSKRTNLRYNLLRFYYGTVFYVHSTITHILGNLKRMHTVTHAIVKYGLESRLGLCNSCMSGFVFAATISPIR